MRLPSDWLEARSNPNMVGAAQTRVFSPSNGADVRIEIFSPTIPLNEKVSVAFRDVLKAAPSLIFERRDGQSPTPSAKKVLDQLQEVLGNAGNNQIINVRTDYLGASFIMERIDSLAWNGVNVLAVRGWFRDPEEDLRLNDFCGIFVDSNPLQSECRVQEIFLEAPSEEVFLRYLPTFKESLDTIRWQS